MEFIGFMGFIGSIRLIGFCWVYRVEGFRVEGSYGAYRVCRLGSVGFKMFMGFIGSIRLIGFCWVYRVYRFIGFRVLGSCRHRFRVYRTLAFEILEEDTVESDRT